MTWGGASSAPLELEGAGEVAGSAMGGGSRSLVYWFRPMRPRRAGGRPVFLWEGLGRAGEGCGGSLLEAVRERGSSEGSESGGWSLA